ncbi:MAG: hypothetical protein ABI451_01730 [Dokdonella sp.]
MPLDTTAHLDVAVTHNPLAFFYGAFTPTVTINGEKQRRPWGTHSFEVSPGAYEVSVSYPWFLSPECGKNTVNFELQAGQRKTVTYRAGVIRYLPGKITVE